jgi:hypothetical protein
MVIAETQCSELLDVTAVLLELAQAINDAAERLIRLVGDLVGPASPDPESTSGCECKRDSAQPSRDTSGCECKRDSAQPSRDTSGCECKCESAQPSRDTSGCECKCESAQPSRERRKYGHSGTTQRDP